MQPFPSVIQNFVDTLQKIKEPWVQYLSQFTIAPPAFMDITVSASPFSYQAEEPGNIYISGGTVSGITLTRGADTITLSTVRPCLVPVAVADIVTVTYSVLPTIKFIPSYGVNTNQ
jgi:hypothetical protein